MTRVLRQIARIPDDRIEHRYPASRNQYQASNYKHPATSIKHSMNQPEDKIPDCFADLDIVFPMGDNGLRQTPAACWECRHKTECLRTGLRGQAGIKVHEEHIDRSYRSGMISFVERWSRKKSIEQRKQTGNTSSFMKRILRCKTKQF